MNTVRHVIYWKTKDRDLIYRTCGYLHVSPHMSVGRTTDVGSLTENQLSALQPLVDSGHIQIRTFSQ